MMLNNTESLKFEEPNVPKSIIFEDVEAFKKINQKYGETFIKNVKDLEKKKQACMNYAPMYTSYTNIDIVINTKLKYCQYLCGSIG